MSRDRGFLGQPQETPVSYIVLLAYAVFMYPGRRAGSDHSLADWARITLSAVGDEIQDGEPWRLLTYAFTHGGLLHVLFNAASLVALGPPLERWLGSARFAVLYAVGALGGSLAGGFWHGPWTPLVGGSGALFAMMGAILALNMRAGRHLLDFLEHGGARSFLGIVLANLVLGWVIPHVSNAAHLGGMLAGFVVTFSFLERGRTLEDKVARAARAGWVALLLTCTLYACFPTARVDFLVRKVNAAVEPSARRPYLEALLLFERSDFWPGFDEYPLYRARWLRELSR
jgi:membrane associated rhomboid family serine protease